MIKEGQMFKTMMKKQMVRRGEIRCGTERADHLIRSRETDLTQLTSTCH